MMHDQPRAQLRFQGVDSHITNLPCSWPLVAQGSCSGGAQTGIVTSHTVPIQGPGCMPGEAQVEGVLGGGRVAPMSLQEVVTGRSPVAAGRVADPASRLREAPAAPHADPSLSHLPELLLCVTQHALPRVFSGSEVGVKSRCLHCSRSSVQVRPLRSIPGPETQKLPVAWRPG